MEVGKEQITEQIVTEKENADRDVQVEYPPGIDDQYNDLEDMLAEAGEDNEEVRDGR